MTSAGHACLVEFGSAPELLAAVTVLRAKGHAGIEAYTPFAVDGLVDAIGPARDWIPLSMLVGGLFGGVGTLAMQYYAAAINYPIDVGGRPDASWPAFVPAALEMTILWAVLFGVVALLIGIRLPRLHHPLFNSARFEAATRDGFFLLLRFAESSDDETSIRGDLAPLHPLSIEQVPL